MHLRENVEDTAITLGTAAVLDAQYKRFKDLIDISCDSSHPLGVIVLLLHTLKADDRSIYYRRQVSKPLAHHFADLYGWG